MVQQETKKKSKNVEEEDGEAGGDKEEQEGEEKIIFVHYEQRKVMLSQLHPIQNGFPDPKTDPPSELRQVRDRGPGALFTSCLLNFITYVTWKNSWETRLMSCEGCQDYFFL